MTSSDVSTSSASPPRMRWPVLIYGGLSYLIAIRSLVYFVLFASNIPWVKTVDSGQIVRWPEALAIDSVLLLSFALSHSLMARSTFKEMWRRRFPEATLRSTYVLVSAGVLSILMWQWRPIGALVWYVEAPTARYLLYGLAAWGWTVAAVAYYSIGHLELFGLRQVHSHFKGIPHESGGLVTTGLYGYLHHPMYVGFTIGMWSTPQMTIGHLLLSVGMTLYVLVGMQYERHDLLVRYGDRYREYQRRGMWSRISTT